MSNGYLPGAELRVLALAGSLRVGSFNRALLHAAQELAPSGMEIQIHEIGSLPFYNRDVEVRGGIRSVAEFTAAIRRADAVLIATPEYNDGIPGVLTNALDWASRKPGSSPLSAKPVALVGAAAGMIGTARAQLHLRQILHHIGASVLPPPEILVGAAHTKFDSAPRLVDEPTRALLARHMERLAHWTAQTRAAAPA